MKKPNILLLMSDQHRADIVGYAGNDVVRTPNLDRLAKDAVVFNNAYTPSPICVPGRQAMTAGKLPGRIGCVHYGDDLPPFSMTFAKRFSQYAYQTVCCGKLHHYGPDQMQGWNMRIGMDNEISPRYIDGKVDEEFEKYKPAEPQWWTWDKEVRRAGAGVCYHMPTDELAVDGAVKYIRQHFLSPYYDREQTHKPLFLKVSLKAPHYPYMCDEDLFTYYLNRVKPYLNQETFDHPALSEEWEEVAPGKNVTVREVTRATAAYYGLIEMLDSMYGEVLEALEHAGQDLDDWIIIYTTDHGDLIGEHNLWMKAKYFEGSARVPLFIRWPKRFNAGEVNENVNLCDLYQTLCDLAEIPAPDDLDSRSLVPLLAGDTSGWDNETVSQLGDTMMIKRDDLKYQYFGERGPDMLFDLNKNPAETVDYSQDPAYAEAITAFRTRRDELLAQYI